MAAADVTIEGTYSVPLITHVCLESHGLTVKWEGDDKMVVWASTQNVGGVAGDLAQAFKMPAANVTVYTDYMGGGFGSKFGADIWGGRRPSCRRWPADARSRCSSIACRSTWRRATAPAPRPTSRWAANRDGKIVAMIAEAHSTGGVGCGGESDPAVCLQRRAEHPG